MKEKSHMLIIKMFLVFFLFGCMNTNILPTANLTPTLQARSSTQTLPPMLPPATFTKTPFSTVSKIPTIAIAGKDYGTIFLVNPDIGTPQQLDISGDTAVNVLGWVENGCSLYVETEKQRVLKLNISGNLVAELADIDSLNLDAAITKITISPDEQWIALILGTGNQGFSSYEFQNLVTVSLQNSKEIYKVTEDSVVTDSSWKFDSGMIAFTDKDNNNIQQIFVTSPSGSNRTQLTHLNMTDLTIRSLKWSPNGEAIAFVIVDEEKHESTLGIVETGDTNNLIVTASVIGVNEFFWLSNDRIMANVLPIGKDSTKLGDRAIAWFDSDTGQELGRISPENLPIEVFQLPGSLANSDQIGFFAHTNFYVYDTSSLQLEKGFDIFTDMRYWVSAPIAIESEDCKILE